MVIQITNNLSGSVAYGNEYQYLTITRVIQRNDVVRYKHWSRINKKGNWIDVDRRTLLKLVKEHNI